MKDEDIQKGKQILNTWLDENQDVLNFSSKEDILKNLLADYHIPNNETLFLQLGTNHMK